MNHYWFLVGYYLAEAAWNKGITWTGRSNYAHAEAHAELGRTMDNVRR